MNTEEVCGARAGKDLRVDTCAKIIWDGEQMRREHKCEQWKLERSCQIAVKTFSREGVKIYPLIPRIPEWWILTSEWVQTRAGGVVFRTDLDLAVPFTSGSTWSRNQFEHWPVVRQCRERNNLIVFHIGLIVFQLGAWSIQTCRAQTFSSVGLIYLLANSTLAQMMLSTRQILESLLTMLLEVETLLVKAGTHRCWCTVPVR
jgi:hypothetical protein